MTDTIQFAPQPLSGGSAKFVLEALAAQLFHAAQPRRLKAGELLFAIGDVGDSCYRLDQGLLKVVVASARGSSPFSAQAQSSASSP